MKVSGLGYINHIVTNISALCTLKTPLTTTCEADDYLCDTVDWSCDRSIPYQLQATLTIDDDAMITCPEQIVHKSSVDQRVIIGTLNVNFNVSLFRNP